MVQLEWARRSEENKELFEELLRKREEGSKLIVIEEMVEENKELFEELLRKREEGSELIVIEEMVHDGRPEVIIERTRSPETRQRLSDTVGSHPPPQARPVKAQADLTEDIRKQLWDIRDFQQHAQERNEVYFRALLSRQSRLQSAVGNIYRLGIQKQQEALLNVLVAVQQMRVEQGETARTVEALRLWAKLMQETGLPADVSLRSAVAALGQTVESLGGINQYVELSFPLVPGICYYKVELGSEHKGALKALYLYLWEMWKEIEAWVAE